MSFRVRESGLPFLFAEVAVDVDNKIGGKVDERESIKELREILYEWQEKGAKGFEENTLFAEATGLKNMNEIPSKLNLLIKDLDSYEELSSQKLEGLRDFCVDASRRFGDYHTDYYGRHSRIGLA